VVDGTGEFSPDIRPKASRGEYFLLGWGRSGGFWKAKNGDGTGSGTGAGLAEGFLSGELDADVWVNLRAMSSDLVGVEGESKDSEADSASLEKPSRLPSSEMYFWGFGDGSLALIGGYLDSSDCPFSR